LTRNRLGRDEGGRDDRRVAGENQSQDAHQAAEGDAPTAPGSAGSARPRVTYDLVAASSAAPVLFLRCDGVIAVANRAFAAQLAPGLDVPDLVGKHISEALPGPLAGQYAGAVADVLRSGAGRTFECQLDSASGRRWIRAEVQPVVTAAGRLIGMSATAHDISARRTFAEELRQSEDRYRALFDHMPVAVAEVDMSAAFAHADQARGQRSLVGWLAATPNAPRQLFCRMRWVGANRAAGALLGARDANEALAALANSATDETLEAMRSQLIMLLSGQVHVESLTVVRTVSGDLRDVIATASVIPDGVEGMASVARVLLSLVDMTESRVLKDQLARTERLAAIGRLAAGVGHEINNPLTYLYGNLQLMQRQLAQVGDSELSRLASEALDGCARVDKIVRDLRSFANPEPEEVGAVDPATVIAAAVRLCQGEIRSRARLVLDLSPVPPVRASANRLEQVLINLLVNAAHSITDGDPDENEIRVAVDADDPDTVEIAVTDTGSGIPEELLAKIFDPFVTMRPGGTGLGLYICHMIVRSLGGRISASSPAGAGTTVRVRLPVAAISGATVPESPRLAAHCPLQRAVVLVIDDEVATLRCMELILAAHDVDTAQSGRQALELLQRRRYDLVLCDLIMPEMTGMSLYRQVVAEDPDLARRFVFMTGGAFTDRAQEFLQSVQNRVLAKPFDIDQLLALVQEYVVAGANQG
jgi:PAS domain S-box-containing protein